MLLHTVHLVARRGFSEGKKPAAAKPQRASSREERSPTYHCAALGKCDRVHKIIDTTTPMGKLVFQVTVAFAEFERSMIRLRVKAGLKRAVAQGTRAGDAAALRLALPRPKWGGEDE
jgi:hypothetical protein